VVNFEDPFIVQKFIFKAANWKINNIIDVGAHYGETAITYHNLFPNANIYCLEPYMPSFLKLVSNVNPNKLIKCYNVALHSKKTQLNFNINKFSQTNSFLKSSIISNQIWGNELLDTIEIQKIKTIALSDFIKNNKIDNIDILKLDTQGTEFEILKSGKFFLKNGYIKLIYVEILNLPTYQNQRNFEEILVLLRNLNFDLYGFYNLSTINGSLRQCDAIFISKHHKISNTFR
jgi:FkbM family methyltransferase